MTRCDRQRWARNGGQRCRAGALARAWGSLGLALVLGLLLTPHSAAQSPQYDAGTFQRGAIGDSTSPLVGDPGNLEMEAKRLDALNAARQKSLVSDTNKLVKLTAELNAQINSTRPASLTEAQMRMVAEIEKLARNIREKMCTSVKGVPGIGPPPPPAFVPPGFQ